MRAVNVCAKRLCLAWLLLWVAVPLFSQLVDPVKFETQLRLISETEAEVVFKGSIQPGWHVYSTNLGDGGPISATFHATLAKGVEVEDDLQAGEGERQEFDKLFGMQVRYFEREVLFSQKVTLTGGAYRLEGYLEYGACNAENCLPPTEVSFVFVGKAAGVGASSDAPQAEEKPLPSADAKLSSWWQPVTEQLQAFGGTAGATGRPWLHVFLAGFLGGLLALLTPCVWPIIPMTVSYFLKRGKGRARGVADAMTYGASIVVIYLSLGLAVTSVAGASALNDLSTNAVVNVFFFLLLVVFAASFFGAFELTLPASWSNAIDRKAGRTGGLLSIFLMAFTLALVSFSCTGPIIGFLLVEVSAQGSLAGPAIGMLGFSMALALPFTFFALFPSWLKQLPKSGGWMNVVKVSLGFIELAFAFKFLSVADLAYGWHLLDREVFLSLWIVIFFLLGLYLLGKIKFPHDDEGERVGVVRFFLSLLSLAFAVYMIPGLWGAPLKAVSAFSPPLHTQDFNLYQKEVRARFDDYDAGMEYARRVGKPVMLDFTGYGCVNCRKMELAVWTDPGVSSIIEDDYVLITLSTDDKTPLEKPVAVTENGRERTLRTRGGRWSYLQRLKFGANVQPFYVLVNNDGEPLNKPYSYDEDIEKYVDFLQTGLKNYRAE